MASQLALTQCLNIQTGFDIIDAKQFLASLHQKYAPGSEDVIDFDWHQMGKDVSALFKRTPKTTFMNGPHQIGIITKQRKIPRRVDRQNSATLVQPELVCSLYFI